MRVIVVAPLSADLAAQLRHATKVYGPVVALDAVDLDIAHGEFVALLGPNGAGKTTAINLLLGLRQPTSGQAVLLGANPRDRVPRSRCGVMLQESGVPLMLSVGEIVRLFRSHYQKPLPAAEVLKLASLESKAHVRADRLSGGERQRLYYAIALCGDPEVLFLDEPTVGMDVEARHHFYGELRALSAAGRTIVLTTHYLEEADQLAQRIVVIDRGHVVEDGTPAQIKAKVPGRRVTVRATRALAPADFEGLAFHGLTMGDHSATLLSNDPVAIVRALVQRSVPLVDLEVTGAALEDAFLALTTRRDRT